MDAWVHGPTRFNVHGCMQVLVQAEEMAARFVAGACPRDLDPVISLPVARLLARVRLALAELRLMQVGGEG